MGDKITGLDSWYEGIGGSSYAGAVDEYTDNVGEQVSATSTYTGHVIDARTASDSDALIEACKVADKSVPDEYIAVYLDQPRPLARCAYHTYTWCGSTPDTQIEVGVFYDLDDGSCDPRDTLTGHSVGLASLADASAHEFAEARTDPTSTSWYAAGGEVADKCNFVFTDPFVTLSNGTQWKLQALWSNYANDNGLGQANGGCVDFNVTGK